MGEGFLAEAAGPAVRGQILSEVPLRLALCHE
jgi:hypothetical protein